MFLMMLSKISAEIGLSQNIVSSLLLIKEGHILILAVIKNQELSMKKLL